MTESPAKVSIQSGELVIRTSTRRWSRRVWRRALSGLLLLTMLLCVIAPILVMTVFGFRNPPTWITDVYEYQINGRLGWSASILMVAMVGMTWLLGVIAAVAGGRAAGGGSESLGQRLGIARRRLAVVTGTTVWLRLALLGVLGLAAGYAYTRLFGPRIDEGLPDEIRLLLGENIATILLVLIFFGVWVIGPIFRTRYSVALGALAASFTRGRTEKIAYALGARFGMELLGTLLALWGLSSILLIVLSIVDPNNYTNDFPVETGPTTILGIPMAVIYVTAFAVLYVFGQIVLSIVFEMLAASRMRRKQAAAENAAEG